MTAHSEPPFEGALARALDGYTVPAMPPDFAERVAQAAQSAAPLPRLRPPAPRWRGARRLALGFAGAGLLASAAAATGILERVGVEIPTAERVWARLSSNEAPRLASAEVSQPPSRTRPAQAPALVEGPIDSPEELEAAFAKADARREERADERRQRVDGRVERRIEAASDRREARGQPRLTAAQEAAIRARVADERARIEQQSEAQRQIRREGLRERIEAGESIDPEALLRQRRAERAALTPEQRRARLREAIRAQRGADQGRQSVAEPDAPELPPA